MKRKNFGAGASSILLIFVVLSLVTFGILSYTTARSDYRLAQKLADSTTAYYTACNQAEQELSLLNRNLLKNSADALQGTAFQEEDGLYTLTVAVTSEKNLTVTVRPITPSGGMAYEIVSYVTAPSTLWEPDNAIHLMQ